MSEIGQSLTGATEAESVRTTRITYDPRTMSIKVEMDFGTGFVDLLEIPASTPMPSSLRVMIMGTTGGANQATWASNVFVRSRKYCGQPWP